MNKLVNKLCYTLAGIKAAVCNNIRKPHVTFYAAKDTSMAAQLHQHEGQIECCLCSSSLIGKTHRKKLNGSSLINEQIRSKVQECAGILNKDIKEFSKLSQDDATLCYHCVSKLSKLIKNEREIKEIKDEMVKLLHKLDTVPIRSIQKRVQNPQSEDPVVRKKICSEMSMPSMDAEENILNEHQESRVNVSPGVSVSYVIMQNNTAN